MTPIPEHLIEDFAGLVADAPDANFVRRLFIFAVGMALYADNANVAKRLDRYCAAEATIRRLAKTPNLLADHRACVRITALAVELLRENGERQPTQRQIVAGLSELGCEFADAVVASVWDTDAFHRQWLRLIPTRRPLAEAIRAQS